MKNVSCRKLEIDRSKAPKKVGTLKDISLFGNYSFPTSGPYKDRLIARPLENGTLIFADSHRHTRHCSLIAACPTSNNTGYQFTTWILDMLRSQFNEQLTICSILTILYSNINDWWIQEKWFPKSCEFVFSECFTLLQLQLQLQLHFITICS